MGDRTNERASEIAFRERSVCPHAQEHFSMRSPENECRKKEEEGGKEDGTIPNGWSVIE